MQVRRTVGEESHFGAVTTKAVMLRNTTFSEEGIISGFLLILPNLF